MAFGVLHPAEQASLTLREPQLAHAEAALTAAVAGLEGER